MLIGLTGKAGAGKDTVADYLFARYDFVGYAFADPMKDSLQHFMRLLGALDTSMHDNALKNKNIPGWNFSPRKVMQLFGTEFGRALDKDLWIRLADRKIAEFKKFGYEDIVVTDVRFPDEADFITSKGGFIVKVVGRSTDIETEAELSHSSENISRIDADNVVFNNRSFTYLHVDIDRMLNELR